MTKRAKKRDRRQDELQEIDEPAGGDFEEEEETTSLPRTRRKAKRRWPLFATLLFVMCVVVIALAPTIISLTPLGPNMVRSAAQGQINGSLDVQSVSFGWLSPVKLTGVTLRDAAGQELGNVKSITVNKSILALLGDRTRLDVIAVDEPQLKLVVRPDGSNLEDLLAPVLKQPASGTPLPEFTVQVTNAKLDVTDAATSQSWQYMPVSAQVISPRASTPRWDLQVDAKLADAAVTAILQQATQPVTGDGSPTLIDLKANKYPLESLRPVLARVAGEINLAGHLSGEVHCELDALAQPRELRFQNVETVGLQVVAPKYLGRDAIAIQQAKANGVARFAQGVWQLKDLQVESDVAALAGTGDVRVSDFTSGNALPQTDCNVRGVVDLARLAEMFPNVLRVREGVEIVAGRANVMLVSHAAGAGRRFEASLTVENLQAKRQGQLVSLKEPVALGAVVTQSAQGWQIEKLDAKSSFLTADVTGTPQHGQLEVRGDLQRLREELAQFFDLTGVKLAGAVTGDVKWQTGGQAIDGSANLRFAQLGVEMPGMLPWHEDELTIAISGEGIEPVRGTYALRAGQMQVTSAKDNLEVQLREPVREITASSPMPVSLKLTGNLATWLPRLQAFVPVSSWQVSGPVELTADANLTASGISAPRCEFKIQQLQATGQGLHIREPTVQGNTQFQWDANLKTASLQNTMLQSTSVAAAAEKLDFQYGDQAKLVGATALRGDLGKLLSWFSDPALPSSMQTFGELEAEARFSVENNTTRAQLAGKVNKLAVAQRVITPNRLVREVSGSSPWQTIWSEPQVIFDGEAAYNAATDTLTLNQMKSTAGTSIISTTGTIAKLSTECLADLKGEVRYDLASLTPLARPYMGETFSISGVTARPFELHGPLMAVAAKSGSASLLPSSLTGKAGMNWDAASWMALEMGSGEMAAEIRDSTIFVQPTSIPLSQGKVNLSPAILLAGPQWFVSQEKTQLIDHVVITPDMCNQWLKYVAPLLVGTTQAEGQFSVDLENARVPVTQVTALSAKGVFTVHNVTVGPGPLAKQLIGIADQVKAFVDGKTGIDSLLGLAGNNLGLPGVGGLLGPAGETPPAQPAAETPAASTHQWLQLPEQQVPVNVADGRVHHQGLAMHVKDIVIRTSGSVGLADQSLSLVAEIPVLDDWIKNKRELAVLKGQTIQIPVTGTVSRPQLDTRALLTFGKSFAYQSATGVINDQMSRGFEKGTGAVQNEVGKVQTKISGELQKGKQKIETELRDGLKGLFGS